MKDTYTNHLPDEPNPEQADMAKILERTAQSTNINPHFKADLEGHLVAAHRPKAALFAPSLKNVASAAGWIAVLIALAISLNWLIRTLAPNPQPGGRNTPVPAPLEENSPTLETLEYQVKAGDTCRSIAEAFGVPVESIIALNNMPADCSTLYIDQVLKIPRQTSSPAPNEEGYDWHGTTLYLAQPLPESPAEANVYLALPDQPATVDSALALAQQFGIEGTVHEAPGELPGTTNFLITDGKQRLYVRSDMYFIYYADYEAETFLLGENIDLEEASAAIEAFLKLHGIDFEHRIEAAQIPGLYNVLPLMPDGLPPRYEYAMPAGLEISLKDDGQIVIVNSDRLNYELVGTYGIRTAEEAFQQLLGVSQTAPVGVQQSSSMPLKNVGMRYWPRSYPDGQTVTIFGRVAVFEAVEANQAPFVSIGEYNTATGNTPPASDNLIEAVGQFYTEDGIRKFNVESWKAADSEEISIWGTLRRQGDQTILLSDLGAEYLLADVPADVPLDTEISSQQLTVTGAMAGGNFVWTSIQYFPQGLSGGGGGGGGGSGFYKLNLSGTPVPLPLPAPVEETSPPSQTLDVPPIEDLRGILRVSIYNQPAGSQRVEYELVADAAENFHPFILLEGADLQGLEAYHNRPVTIWGAADRINENGALVVKVERYEIPYPDLQFQILKGSEKPADLQGQSVILFSAEDGTTYIPVAMDGAALPPSSLSGGLGGAAGDQILVEALAIPGESFAGYPALRIFIVSPAINPQNGQPMELSVSTDQPLVTDEPPPSYYSYTPTTATIEQIELVYYISDPRYAVEDPTAGPAYIQPAWRFSGHYSSGDMFEVLVQALKDEFLLPEMESMEPPG